MTKFVNITTVYLFSYFGQLYETKGGQNQLFTNQTNRIVFKKNARQYEIPSSVKRLKMYN